jgi:hypothetical protein
MIRAGSSSDAAEGRWSRAPGEESQPEHMRHLPGDLHGLVGRQSSCGRSALRPAAEGAFRARQARPARSYRCVDHGGKRRIEDQGALSFLRATGLTCNNIAKLRHGSNGP